MSVHPEFFLRAAMVLFKVGAGAVPSKQVAVVPKPTKSATPESGKGQLFKGTLKCEPALINATFPEAPKVAAMGKESLCMQSGDLCLGHGLISYRR
ncbi:MAG TPA: hypothetical protein VF074_05800 [Pyrinomonadaceae bacterium]